MKSVLLLALLAGLAVDLNCETHAQPRPTTNEKTNATSGTKNCFGCGATGHVKCDAAGCEEGLTECPGPCMKLSKGTWEHLEVAGHSPDELWQKFYDDDGKWHAWTTGHVGEVIEMQNGKAVNIGKCPRCSGTTKVKCSGCAGTGQVVCPVCQGKKVVPAAANWESYNHAKPKSPPVTIRLTDGRTLVGRIEMRLGSKIQFRTEEGKVLDLDAGQIVNEPGRK